MTNTPVILWSILSIRFCVVYNAYLFFCSLSFLHSLWIALAGTQRQRSYFQIAPFATDQLQSRRRSGRRRWRGKTRQHVVCGVSDFRLVAVLHALEAYDLAVVQEQGRHVIFQSVYWFKYYDVALHSHARLCDIIIRTYYHYTPK